MKSGVPTSEPTWVEEVGAASAFARPKSVTLTRPSGVRIRFEGLTSRCTNPARCGVQPERGLLERVERLDEGSSTSNSAPQEWCPNNSMASRTVPSSTQQNQCLTCWLQKPGSTPEHKSSQSPRARASSGAHSNSVNEDHVVHSINSIPTQPILNTWWAGCLHTAGRATASEQREEAPG